MIKGTKLDFYSVASPSPFAHRQITWLVQSSQITNPVIYPQTFPYSITLHEPAVKVGELASVAQLVQALQWNRRAQVRFLPEGLYCSWLGLNKCVKLHSIFPSTKTSLHFPYFNIHLLKTSLCFHLRYSYDYGLVHYIMMSTEHDMGNGSRQYSWLEQDLKNVDRTKTPWIILAGHRPMYTSELALGNVDLLYIILP